MNPRSNSRQRKALWKSIQKWHNIVFYNGLDRANKNCPLCILNTTCYSCCIYVYTRKSGCQGIGWMNWLGYQQANGYNTDSNNKSFKVFDGESLQLAANVLYKLEEIYARM